MLSLLPFTSATVPTCVAKLPRISTVATGTFPYAAAPNKAHPVHALVRVLVLIPIMLSAAATP